VQSAALLLWRLMEIRILLADRQELFRKALRRLLEQELDFKVLADTDDGEKLSHIVAEHKPDVLLMDIKLRKRSGIEVLREITVTRPVLLIDAAEQSDITQALIWGAQGIIRKDAPTQLLFKCIRTVAAGQYWVSHDEIPDLVQNLRSLMDMVEKSTQMQTRSLSKQQRQIVESIVSGCTNREIAKELSISERTVKYHLTRIFSKLGVSGRMELARFSLKRNLIPEE
jgi:two-component system, NarL family, nitrate/nitrite response regulator NarL